MTGVPRGHDRALVGSSTAIGGPGSIRQSCSAETPPAPVNLPRPRDEHAPAEVPPPPSQVRAPALVAEADHRLVAGARRLPRRARNTAHRVPRVRPRTAGGAKHRDPRAARNTAPRVRRKTPTRAETPASTRLPHPRRRDGRSARGFGTRQRTGPARRVVHSVGHGSSHRRHRRLARGARGRRPLPRPADRAREERLGRRRARHHR